MLNTVFVSFVVYLALVALLQRPMDEDNEMIAWYLMGVAMAPVCAFLILRTMDWLYSKRKRILNKTRRANNMHVPRYQVGQEDITAPPGVKHTGHRICIGGNRRAGRTNRSSLAQLNRETHAKDRVMNKAKKQDLNADITDLKQQIAKAGLGKGKTELRAQLTEKEGLLKQVLLMGDDADQKEAMGNLEGEWTPDKAAALKLRKEMKIVQEAENIGLKGDLKEMAKLVEMKVANEISSLHCYKNRITHGPAEEVDDNGDPLPLE